MSDCRCIKCGASLTWDDIGAHKKLINRGAEEFYCITCLAEYLGVKPETVRNKIEEFRAAGCMLFPKRSEK